MYILYLLFLTVLTSHSLPSKLFSDADVALRECDVMYVTKWRRYLQVKIKFYAAYARSFQGEHLLTLDKCGDSIKTLQEAQKRQYSCDSGIVKI